MAIINETAKMANIMHDVATRIIFGNEQVITVETKCEMFTFVDDGLSNVRVYIGTREDGRYLASWRNFHWGQGQHIARLMVTG